MQKKLSTDRPEDYLSIAKLPYSAIVEPRLSTFASRNMKNTRLKLEFNKINQLHCFD